MCSRDFACPASPAVPEYDNLEQRSPSGRHRFCTTVHKTHTVAFLLSPPRVVCRRLPGVRQLQTRNYTREKMRRGPRACT